MGGLQMKRKIVKIDEEKCNGCGLCADACHEGAIRIVGGKAKLVSESYCDGLGACLPACPEGAISIEEREAQEFDEKYAREHQEKERRKKMGEKRAEPPACGCPAVQTRVIERGNDVPLRAAGEKTSQLKQWPIQIKLVPSNAPFFDGASLLIAADCTAYAYAGMHQKYMSGKVALIGCPKLDDADYSEKLTQILSQNDIRSITVLRMEVPCCGGIVEAVKRAMKASGNMIPWQAVTISVDGEIVEE